MDNEELMCTSCRHQLPVTNYHFVDNEAVKKVLYGRIKLKNATSLLHFSKKGLVQELLHNLKYRGHEDIGKHFGQWLGAELKETGDYNSVDVVIPVPLHKSKLRSRGYNQVDKFAQEIALALNVEFRKDLLIKQFATKTQVFKNRLMRYDDAKAQFKLIDTEILKNKHVLLVDDIITTGATLETCANELLKTEGLTLSVATIAIAD
ncbi:phosphoribosyltransferase family protein [Winogradskyella maritima]|uniref:ComF family protein n=1 Tax=Winogradskyella maritima TaxID=1517766 RepID=A0ABV8AF23_9FLAO|nr:phosphoribosyltransferase family protein [Winogradskyella maritima]